LSTAGDADDRDVGPEFCWVKQVKGKNKDEDKAENQAVNMESHFPIMFSAEIKTALETFYEEFGVEGFTATVATVVDYFRLG